MQTFIASHLPASSKFNAFKTLIYSICLCLAVLAPVTARAEKLTLIRHVNVWDGTSDSLKQGYSVLITGNLITAVEKEIDTPQDAVIIDGKGQTLIPGLSDAHTHFAQTSPSITGMRNDENWMYVGIKSALTAKQFLMLGFTTVRDLGGPSFGVKQAIDEGLIPGPRIYPSGAFISQTSGHGDFRNYNEPNRVIAGGPVMPMDQQDWFYLVDGKAEVRKAARENLRKGATQLKVMAGGGIASDYDPIHSVQFAPEEIKAAVEAAKDWDTYVAVHAYTEKSIIRALEAGVKSIDHGQLISEEAMKLVKEKDAWLVPQSHWGLRPAPDLSKKLSDREKKSLMVREGINREMTLAKKYKVNLAYGTDVFGSLGNEKRALNEFTSRVKWFTPLEVLKQATSENARLFAMSGKLNPYTEGKLGVIEPGAYADILIYSGNPLIDEQVVVNYSQNLKFIMKDGEIFKNVLDD
ncbi:amidohydrolase family protein [Alteromonas sp. NFXS44]|uniref:metal-dependent hydrolase family protein n=1 Tax=Alteromonas sp. NFXS44 TaxID=2818435 RepID=UPI0032E026D6